MNGLSRADRTVEAGQYGTVEYAVRRNGTLEAKTWLDSQPQNKIASFAVLFRRIVVEGRIANKTQFRQLRNQIWEFKRGGDRILCYHLGSRRLLTHHIKKGGSRKCPQREIERAARIAEEHIRWESHQEKGK